MKPSIQWTLRSALILCLTTAALSFAAGCASDGGSGGAARGGSGLDQSGTKVEAADGSPLARVVSIDTSAMQTEGKVKYTLENTSGQDLEDLIWSVSFHFPPGKAQDEIQVSEEVEATSERALSLYKTERAKVIEATCPGWTAARAGTVRGTSIRIVNEPPVPVLTRGPSAGTYFFGGRLECTAVASAGELEAETPQLWIELENIDKSRRKASDLEVQAVFPNGGGRTKWKALGTVQPGQRGRVTLDLKGVDLGDREFLIKVRPQAL